MPLGLKGADDADTLLTLIRIFEELRGRGCGGGYDACRYAGAKQQGHATAVGHALQPRASPGAGVEIADMLHSN